MAYGEDPQAYNPYTLYINNPSQNNRQEVNTQMFYDWAPIKGLTARGTISLDNTFIENGRGINDANNNVQRKWINPETGAVIFREDKDINTQLEFRESVRWGSAAGAVDNNATYRRMFSQFQLNYATSIAAKHNITAMGLWSRDQFASGTVIPSYREDWVFRTTYNYKGKYTAEYNGAYNGSERFGPDYRFEFFSSGGLGWVISEESFLKSVSANCWSQKWYS